MPAAPPFTDDGLPSLVGDSVMPLTQDHKDIDAFGRAIYEMSHENTRPLRKKYSRLHSLPAPDGVSVHKTTRTRHEWLRFRGAESLPDTRLGSISKSVSDYEVALEPAGHHAGAESRFGPAERAPIVTYVALHGDRAVDLEGHGLATAPNTAADELGQVFCTRHVVTLPV